MPDGKVISGGQNDWKTTGAIEPLDENGKMPYGNVIEYKKGHITKNTSRKDNECWTGGTPVTWKDDPSKAKPVTIKLAGIPDMLVTKVNGKITEYHPVITFFNEVMAQIMRDGHRDVISNLEEEENAVKMWEYLESKYLNGPQKINGSSLKKIVAAKKTNPAKKSRPTKLTKRSSRPSRKK